MRHLNWLIARQRQGRQLLIRAQFADHRTWNKPVRELAARIRWAIKEAPCDLLFVHRDAESEPLEKRLAEITAATESVEGLPVTVPIIPVTMTEAWLLFDEKAIRRAADNPAGENSLHLPKTIRVESVRDPKETLHALLLKASEKSGRRRAQFERDLSARVQRVADYIEDFSVLMDVPAFAALAARTSDALSEVLPQLEP